MLTRLVVSLLAMVATLPFAAAQQRSILVTKGQLTDLPKATISSGNWPSFRGPGASGVADGQKLPDTWDIKTGENIGWRVPIPGLGHSSPIVWGERIFVTSAISSRPDATFVPGIYGAGTPADDASKHRWMVYCLDARTGKVEWERVAYEGVPITAPTPIFSDGVIIVASGRAPERPIFVVRPGARGDVTLPEGATSSDAVVWSRTGRGPYMPTPLAYDHSLYVLANNGVFHAYELATGKQIYEARLPVLGNGYSASPVAADGKIYVSGEDGDVSVLASGPTFKPLATNSMGEPLMATPAMSRGVMYLRTSMSLVAVRRSPRALTDAERARRGLDDSRQKNFVPWTELAATTPPDGAVMFDITVRGQEHAAFAGTWNAKVPGEQEHIVLKLVVEGTRVSGDLIQGTVRTIPITDGSISGNRIAFKAFVANGNRTVAFVGNLDGNEIAFTRTVQVHEGGVPGGRGFFGAQGAPSFVATRVSK